MFYSCAVSQCKSRKQIWNVEAYNLTILERYLNVYTFLNITWIFKSQRNENHRFYSPHYEASSLRLVSITHWERLNSLWTLIFQFIWQCGIPLWLPLRFIWFWVKHREWMGITAWTNNMSPHSKECAVTFIHILWIFWNTENGISLFYLSLFAISLSMCPTFSQFQNYFIK